MSSRLHIVRDTTRVQVLDTGGTRPFCLSILKLYSVVYLYIVGIPAGRTNYVFILIINILLSDRQQVVICKGDLKDTVRCQRIDTKDAVFHILQKVLRACDFLARFAFCQKVPAFNDSITQTLRGAVHGRLLPLQSQACEG